MKNFNLTVFSIFLAFSFSITAQKSVSSEPAKNVVSATFGTLALIYSAQLTYDRFLTKDEGFFKSYYLSAKAGRNVYIDFSGNNSGTGYLTSLGATALTGKGKNHFEFGLGLGYFIDSEIENDEADFDFDNNNNNDDESRLYLSISIGYRKQTSNGFMFRTGIGVAEWAYVGFGYSF